MLGRQDDKSLVSLILSKKRITKPLVKAEPKTVTCFKHHTNLWGALTLR